jgi:hypothetical protein
MSNLDEQLINRLKTLDRWLPRLQSAPASRVKRRPPQGVSASEEPRLDDDASPSGDPELQIVSDWQPSLEQAIDGLSDVPEHAALIGVCEDGLPFLLDLANPTPGAILLAGDAASGKTPLLRAILASASLMNPAQRVSFNLIASQPDEYQSLHNDEHCQEYLPVEDPGVNRLIAALVSVIETRKHTGPQDPALILAIDDLVALLPFLDEGAFSGLYWLIRHGPRYQVWTIATLPASQIEQIEPRFLTAFRTRLFGYMRDERVARHLANDDHVATRDLEKGRQFFVPYNGDWLRFWICEPETASSEPAATEAANDPLDFSETGGVG